MECFGHKACRGDRSVEEVLNPSRNAEICLSFRLFLGFGRSLPKELLMIGEFSLVKFQVTWDLPPSSCRGVSHVTVLGKGRDELGFFPSHGAVAAGLAFEGHFCPSPLPSCPLPTVSEKRGKWASRQCRRAGGHPHRALGAGLKNTDPVSLSRKKEQSSDAHSSVDEPRK